MSLKLGYLLPTRENVMRGQPQGRLLLDGARYAADQGFDSVWAGDSLLARPRHDPLTLLAAVAGAVAQIELGTAVLLPALRNPVVLAQQLATLDQMSEGRLIVGVGIAADAPAIRHEFAAAGVEFAGRVGRLLEGVRLWRALWSGESVDWEGRWTVKEGVLGPMPWRDGGPPVWLGTGVKPGLERTAKHFDGWLPLGAEPQMFVEQRAYIDDCAQRAGREPRDIDSAFYMTLCIMDDREAANQAIERYLEAYYGVPGSAMRKLQACCGGPLEEVLGFIRSYAEAGVKHFVIRLVGDHEGQIDLLSRHRGELD